MDSREQRGGKGLEKNGRGAENQCPLVDCKRAACERACNQHGVRRHFHNAGCLPLLIYILVY